MNNKYISDLHIGHRAICKYRTEFNSMDEHDEYVVDKIASSVGKRDQLFVLGDVCFDLNKMHLLNRIECGKKTLLLGNHCLERGPKHVSEYFPYFDDVQGFIKQREFWLSHCPIHPNELRDKTNIHGHDHAYGLKEIEYVNVTCENINYIPISMHEIRVVLNARREAGEWIHPEDVRSV